MVSVTGDWMPPSLSMALVLHIYHQITLPLRVTLLLLLLPPLLADVVTLHFDLENAVVAPGTYHHYLIS